PATGTAVVGPRFPDRAGWPAHLPARQSPAHAGGDDAAGLPAAGNRRPGPAGCRHPRPAQRTGAAGGGCRLRGRIARAGSGGNRSADDRQCKAPVQPAEPRFAVGATQVATGVSSGKPRVATCVAPTSFQRTFGLSSISSALPAVAKANAPVIWVAAPSPAPQSSFSAASAPRLGRRPQTLPSACGYFTFSSEYTAGTPK